MWTIDMSRCPSCPYKDDCKDRKKLLSVLSPTSNELNTDPAYVEGPGDGIVIVACHYKRQQ